MCIVSDKCDWLEQTSFIGDDLGARGSNWIKTISLCGWSDFTSFF